MLTTVSIWDEPVPGEGSSAASVEYLPVEAFPLLLPELAPLMGLVLFLGALLLNRLARVWLSALPVSPRPAVF